MLIRVGTCTSCDATFQLSADFASPWVRCRICEGPVQVGEPSDPADATKRRRSAGAGKTKTAGPGAKRFAAMGSAEATLDKSAENVANASAKKLEDAGEATAAVLDEIDLNLEEMELIEDALDGPNPPAAEMPARTVASKGETAQKSAGKWSPAELERRAKADKEAAAAKAAATADVARHKAEEAAAESAAAESAAAESAAAEAKAAKAAKSAKAAKAAAAAAAAPELVEVTRSKKEGLSTLERLKAERAAGGEAPDAAPQGKSERGGTLTRLKAERAAAAPAQPAARSKPAAAAKAAGSSSRRSSRRGGEDEPEQESGGRRRQGTGRQRDRGKGGLIGVASLIVLGGAGFAGFQLGWFDAPAPPVVDEEVADADAAGTPVEPIADPFAATGVAVGDATLDTPPADAGDDAAAYGDAEDAADSESSTTDDEPDDEPSAPAPDVARPGRDPASIDLTAIADFERFPGTSDEDWATAQKHASKALDPYATRGLQKAQDDLIAMGRPAVPAVLNELKALDLTDLPGAGAGWIGVDVLTQIANGNGYSWRQAAEIDAQWYNKTSTQKWCEEWDELRASDEAWAKFAKLDPVTLEPLSAEDRNKPKGDEGS